MVLKSKEKLDINSLQKIAQKSSISVIREMMNEVNPLINNLQNNTISQELHIPLINYMIIRLVSIIENYFRNFTIDLIDNYGFPFKGVFSNNEIVVSLLDLNEIKKNKKITVGRIIAETINFQNLSQINFVLSKILGGKSFFDLMNKMIKTTFFGDVPHANKDAYWFDWNEFNELFTIRHDIVHRLQSNTHVDIDKLVRFTAHVSVFCTISQVILIQKYLKEYGSEMKMKDPKKYSEVTDQLKRLENTLASYPSS